MIVKLISYNIRHGTDENNFPRLIQQANLLMQQKADFVFLQECDLRVNRSGNINQVKFLANFLGLPYFAFGNNLKYTNGHYGIAILSRFPLHSVVNHRLPILAACEEKKETIDGKMHFPEHRSVLAAISETPQKKILLLNTHASVWEKERVIGSQLIYQLIQKNFFQTKTVFLGGDFNTPDQQAPEIRILKELLQDPHERCQKSTATFPSSQPKGKIDYLFVAGGEILSADIVESFFSDHFLISSQIALVD